MWNHSITLDSQFRNLTIDPETNRLFYAKDKTSIGVLEGNILANSSIYPIHHKVLIADSYFTANVSCIVVVGNVVVWTSKNLPSERSLAYGEWQVANNIFMGELKNNFVRRRSINSLETPAYNHKYNNTVIVKRRYNRGFKTSDIAN